MVGGTGLLVGEKVPPRYSCVCKPIWRHCAAAVLPACRNAGAGVLLAYPGAGVHAKQKEEEVAAPGCQVSGAVPPIR